MKVNKPRFAPLAVILTILFPVTGRAENASLHAKIEYCNTCHGLSGQGYRGFFPIPRLAGQQTEYIENQLAAFIERRRANKYMYDVAHVLSPAVRRALAQHYSGLNPKPLGGAAKNLVAAGKKIYEEGTPETNVPACMACHGAEAKGQKEIPRLAGQLDDYIFNKLVNWNKERGQDPKHPDISALMLPTSHNLTKAQIAEIAAYVSYLR